MAKYSVQVSNVRPGRTDRGPVAHFNLVFEGVGTLYRCALWEKNDGTHFVTGPSFQNPTYGQNPRAKEHLRPFPFEDEFAEAVLDKVESLLEAQAV